MTTPRSQLARLAGLLVAGPAAAQIVTENAGVISPELTILREWVGVSRSENLDEVRWNHQVLYAVDRADEFRLTVPVVWRTARFDPGSGEEEVHEAGLGDVSLRYKRGLSRADDVMHSERWALLLEFGAPTGDHDEAVNGNPVPRPLQLGTGDWSLGGGTAYTWIQDRQRFALEGFYRHRTRHDGVQLGDTLDLNAAYWYRFTPAVFGAGESGSELRGVIELLGTHQFPSEVGSDLQDDDGTIVWLAPGIQYYPGTRVLLEANVEVPLAQSIQDALGDRRWSANLVLKLLF